MAHSFSEALVTKRVSIGDAALTVSQVGTGPDLVLIAGLFGSGAFFDAQIAAFAQRFRVTFFDHRDVGDSTPRPAGRASLMTAAELADDLIRLLDALGIRRAHILGHSSGGAVVQHAAAAHPDRIDRMVLSGSWSRPTGLFRAGFELRRAVLRTCGPDDYFLLSTLLSAPAEWVGGSFISVDAYFAARRVAFAGADVEAQRIDAVIGLDTVDVVARISTPTLVLAAADDQIVPLDMARDLADRISGAELSVIDRGGHFLVASNAPAYNACVLDFLTGDGGAPR
jgi:aminoacrylate hydrolase